MTFGAPMIPREINRWRGNTRGRSCVCVVFVLAVLLVPHPTRAAASGWAQVTVAGHGIRLTLSIRRRSYPQTALVRVWARMQNTRNHTAYVYDPGPQAAGKYIPQAVVLAEPGGEPLPISLTDYMPYPGPGPLSLHLPAHMVRNIPELIILRGPLVRLDLTLASGPGLPARSGPTLSTPLLHVPQLPADTPTVTLHLPPSQPGADITSAEPVPSNLLAVWSLDCGTATSSSTIQQNIDWTVISSHITPTCSPLVGWHEIAGWLNHSVAQIDWGQR